jgi:hypothetical protein
MVSLLSLLLLLLLLLLLICRLTVSKVSPAAVRLLSLRQTRTRLVVHDIHCLVVHDMHHKGTAAAAAVAHAPQGCRLAHIVYDETSAVPYLLRPRGYRRGRGT